MFLLIVLFHVLNHNHDSSVNRPISNCIMILIADNKFKNRVQKFTAYAVFSLNPVVYMVKFDKGA